MTRGALAGVVLCAGLLSLLTLRVSGPDRSVVIPEPFGPDDAPRPEAIAALLGGDRKRATAFLTLWRAIDARKREVIAASDADGASAPAGGTEETWRAADAAVLRLGEAQADRLLKEYALLESFFFLPRRGDAGRAARVLREVPPESPVWSLSSPDASSIFDAVGATLDWSEAVRHYGERGLDHPAPRIRLAFLSCLFEAARLRHDADEAGRTYRMLLSGFPASREAADARKEFAPDRLIRVGETIPPFSIASLDDAGARLTRETIAGRRVLIEFWASWCPPCLDRMPALHRLAEKYAADHFTILSVAVDDTRQAIGTLRRSRWPMPWLHGILTDGQRDPTWESFEMVSIPRLILVDGRGVILATDDELEPDLESAVAAALERDDGAGGK